MAELIQLSIGRTCGHGEPRCELCAAERAALAEQLEDVRLKWRRTALASTEAFVNLLDENKELLAENVQLREELHAARAGRLEVVRG